MYETVRGCIDIIILTFKELNLFFPFPFIYRKKKIKCMIFMTFVNESLF